MSGIAVATVSRALPPGLQRRILRCAMTALREAGATDIATAITPSDVVVRADVPEASEA
jgi:hypothetical protein